MSGWTNLAGKAGTGAAIAGVSVAYYSLMRRNAEIERETQSQELVIPTPEAIAEELLSQNDDGNYAERKEYRNNNLTSPHVTTNVLDRIDFNEFESDSLTDSESNLSQGLAWFTSSKSSIQENSDDKFNANYPAPVSKLKSPIKTSEHPSAELISSRELISSPKLISSRELISPRELISSRELIPSPELISSPELIPSPKFVQSEETIREKSINALFINKINLSDEEDESTTNIECCPEPLEPPAPPEPNMAKDNNNNLEPIRGIANEYIPACSWVAWPLKYFPARHSKLVLLAMALVCWFLCALVTYCTLDFCYDSFGWKKSVGLPSDTLPSSGINDAQLVLEDCQEQVTSFGWHW